MERDLLLNRRYRIVRPLGEGGIGVVHLAHDTFRGEREVALKILRPEAVDPDSIERFRNEFRSMTRLRHPNLAEVCDFGEDERTGRHFLTLEFIEGKPLGAFRWPALHDHFDEVVVQCLRALDYIHSRGLLHNDIKPQNILVRPPLQVKLVDFGLARSQADPSRADLSGTIHYIAPERIRGEPPDPRSDIYSLGVVLYELLTGRLAFEEQDVGRVVTAILHGPIPPPRQWNPDVPSRLDRFVTTLLARDPTGRPASAGEALALLNRGSAAPLSLDTAETVASYVGSGRFIGRRRELQSLCALAAEHAGSPGEDRQPRLVLIAGDSGIGKSRLLREVRYRLQALGMRTLSGRCHDAGGTLFQPFVEILRHLPRGPGACAEMTAALDQILPGGAAVRGELGAGAGEPGGSAGREHLLAGLAAALDALAAGKPGFLFLEDLHWCDRSGLDLIEYLLARQDRGPWLILGSLRGDAGRRLRFEDGPVSEHVLRIQLGPLRPEEIGELVASMMPFDRRPERLISFLQEQTGGNPLYVEEIVRVLAENRIIRREERAWGADEALLDGLEIPSSLSSILARRLEGLSVPDRELLEALSIFNRPASAALLAGALERAPEEIRSRLEALDRLDLVELDTEGAAPPLAEIAHARIREVIAGRLQEERRRTLHLAAGNALERAHADDIGAVVEEMAHHSRAAGERERAVDHSLRAAGRAAALFYPDRQTRFLTWALELLPEGDPRRLDALRVLADNSANARAAPGDALRYGGMLAQEARNAGDILNEAFALRAQSYATAMLGDMKAALELAAREIELSRRVGDPAENCHSLNLVGALRARLGEFDRALEAFREVRVLSEKIDPGRALTALNNEANCHLALGDPFAARELQERGLARARDLGLMNQYYRLRGNQAVTLCAAGDLPGAIRSLEESLEWARAHGNLQHHVHELTTLAQYYAQTGLLDRSAGCLAEHRAFRMSSSDVLEQIMNLDLTGALSREVGRIDEALERHREGLDLARKHGQRVQEGFLLAALATDRLEGGDAPGAELAGRDALRIGRELSHPRIMALAHCALALAAARRGDHAAAAARIQEMDRIETGRITYLEQLRASLVRGRCALLAGRIPEAESEARAGIAAAAPGGFREYEWRFQALLGEALRAEGLLTEAADAYNSAYAVIRAVSAEIEDPVMRQDYEQEPTRAETARCADADEPSATSSRPGSPAMRFDAAAPPEPPAPQADAFATGHGAPATRSSIVPSLRPFETAADIPVRMLATMYEISQMVSSILDLEELLNKVMDLAIEIVRAERGLIFLYRSDIDEMQMVVARNIEKETIRDATEYSRNIVKEAGLGRSILSHDAVTDERFRDFRSVATYRIHSLLCVPLKVRNQVVGTVYVDTRRPGVVFSRDDLKFLEAFAHQAAVAIENARLYDQVRQENRYLKQVVRERYGFENIIGRSARMRAIFKMISRVAPSSLPVMIRGESGTGKELVARAIHLNSPRKDRRFFTENCAALPDTLLESELFGHVKGAFTGADSSRKGLFELSDGGTLFLDEIGDMSVALQSKLLRVLQDGEIRPLGSETPRHVDVRILSATNRDLEQMIAKRTFREDLYFRLNVITLRIPALRERPEDIPLLVDHFLSRVAEENNVTKLRVDRGLIALLTRYHWPGNVRELENQIYKLALFANGPSLTAEDAKQDAEFYSKVISTRSPGSDNGIARDPIERALAEAGGNRDRAAELLGISRATLFRRLKELDIGKKRPRGPLRRDPHRRP
ncbi:MAG: sigma 54-interacting transcriptional regulator [Acidobacteriota bacterium]